MNDDTQKNRAALLWTQITDLVSGWSEEERYDFFSDRIYTYASRSMGQARVLNDLGQTVVTIEEA